jgi:predicted nucleic acid-binding protein
MHGPEVFLDASYAIALTLSSDTHHGQAVQLRQWIETAGARVVTTSAILMEIGNALARRAHRAAAVRILRMLERDPGVEIVPFSPELFARAVRLFCERPDKEWGVTDCLSFEVMRERGITDALTADEHFEQAGYRALLRHT